MFIDTIILEHSHAYLFMYGLWQFLHYSCRVEMLQQLSYGLQSPKYLLPGPLQEKFLDPWSIWVEFTEGLGK